VSTVPDVILQYSLWSGAEGIFKPPTQGDIDKHRVIITTLSTARYVSDVGLGPGKMENIGSDLFRGVSAVSQQSHRLNNSL
jgi:hypothetical protein